LSIILTAVFAESELSWAYCYWHVARSSLFWKISFVLKKKSYWRS